MAITTRITGLSELRTALLGLAPKLRRRALRASLAAGARVFRDEAQRLAPRLQAPIVRNGVVIRQPGTLRKAIRVRTSKLSTRAGNVGVFVNVKPAAGARFKTIKGGALFGLLNKRVQTRASQRGANSPTDPFYWRFVEFGTRHAPAQPFLRPAANNKNSEALRRITQTLGPQILKLNVRGGGGL